jgi:hypothetical protein
LLQNVVICLSGPCLHGHTSACGVIEKAGHAHACAQFWLPRGRLHASLELQECKTAENFSQPCKESLMGWKRQAQYRPKLGGVGCALCKKDLPKGFLDVARPSLSRTQEKVRNQAQVVALSSIVEPRNPVKGPEIFENKVHPTLGRHPPLDTIQVNSLDEALVNLRRSGSWEIIGPFAASVSRNILVEGDQSNSGRPWLINPAQCAGLRS